MNTNAQSPKANTESPKAEATSTIVVDFACRKHLLLPDWHEGLAKVIDIAKQFE